MPWRWANLDRVLDPWMAAHAAAVDEQARSAVLFHMCRLAEDGDLVTGELVPRHSALVRRYYVHEARSCIIWLRAEQYHCLNLIAIQT